VAADGPLTCYLTNPGHGGNPSANWFEIGERGRLKAGKAITYRIEQQAKCWALAAPRGSAPESRGAKPGD
jgi:hypothetical protein